MTRPLSDALDDLVTAVPDHIVTEELAARAWTAGRRRRRRKHLVNGVATGVVVAAMSAVLLPLADEVRSLPASDSGHSEGVTAYPTRIGHQWWIRDLPDRPGAVAGLINLVSEHRTWDEPDGWYALTSTGRRWRIRSDERAGTYPTLSPDGRHLGYLTHDNGPYVIHDLVSGRRFEFPDVGSAISPGTTAYQVAAQNPSFWSPDGTQLFLPGWFAGSVGSQSASLVVGVNGSSVTTALPEDEWFRRVVGWYSNNELVVVTVIKDDPDDSEVPARELRADIVTLDGHVSRSVTLAPLEPWVTGSLDQWAVTISANGSAVLVREELDIWDVRVHQFSLRDGAPHGEPADISGLRSEACGSAMPDSTLAVVPMWDEASNNATVGTLSPDGTQPIVVIEPGLGSRCLLLAPDALAGDARGGLLGTSTAWWTWWWREILAAILLVVGTAAIRRLRRQGRTAFAPPS